MNVCSYLEEYNKNFLAKSEEEFHIRIKEVKKIAKPAVKKINEWKDLREYRNHMIAHNFRIDGNEFCFNMLGQYNAPRTYRDIAMLRKHLMMIQGIIEAEFRNELQYVNSYIQSFEVKEQKISYETVEEDLIAVLDEINQLCLKNSKPYQLIVDLFMKL